MLSLYCVQIIINLRVTTPVPARWGSRRCCKAAVLPSWGSTDTSIPQWEWWYPACLPPHRIRSDSGCLRRRTWSRRSRDCSPIWHHKRLVIMAQTGNVRICFGVFCVTISPHSCGYIPRQGVVEVIWHNLLVAVTKRQNRLRKLGFRIIQTAVDRSLTWMSVVKIKCFVHLNPPRGLVSNLARQGSKLHSWSLGLGLTFSG